jgi:hypothetical protein
MNQPSFKFIAEEIITSIHNMNGLDEDQLNQFLLALQKEKEEWIALDMIPKSQAYTLIMCRESVMDYKDYYKDNNKMLSNFNKAESAINFLIEDALLNNGDEDKSCFGRVSMNIVLAVRNAEGLSDIELKQFAYILQNEEKDWASSSAIPKQKIYTLIVLRDNIIGAQKWYQKDKKVMNNMKKAEATLNLFTKSALSTSV